MSLYRSASGIVAVLWCLCGLVFLASETFTIAHLVQLGEWQQGSFSITLSAGFFAVICFLFVLICAVLMMVMSIAALRQSQLLQATAARDVRFTRESVYQPDRNLALHDGETLTLARSHSFKQVVVTWLKLSLLFVVALILDEIFILSLLPSFWRNPYNPLYAPSGSASAPSPSVGDWFATLCQVAISIAIWVIVVYAIYRDHRETLVVDDQGIMVRRSGRPTRRIAWNDLAVFLRMADRTGNSPVGTYGLWGTRHGTWLEIHSQESEALDGVRQSRHIYTYEGGYSTYKQNAERMLATIAARSYLPLLVRRETTRSLSNGRARAFVIRSGVMSLEEINALPLATNRSLDANASTQSESAREITLNARFSKLGLVIESLLIAVPFFAVGSFIMSRSFDLRKAMPPDLSPSTVTLVIAACYLFIGAVCIPAGWAIAYTRRRSALPVVSADSRGLCGFSSGASPEIAIQWSDVTAWVAAPSREGEQGSTWFVVCGHDQKRIVWQESGDLRLAGRGVRGDRRLAFQQRANELHALIAAKTGLPLHEFVDGDNSARSLDSLPPVSQGDKG